SIPTFWLGNLLIYEFSYRLKLLPLGGYGSGGAWWRPNPLNLILPAITLAIVEFFFYARFVHTNVGGTLASDYIRTARAKGAPPARLYFVHALRNALIPIVTLLGLDIAALMSGVVLTETVFNWPGPGRRDVWARLSYSARTSLFVGGLAMAVSLATGMAGGLVAGYFGGLVDAALMWLVDLVLTLPSLLLLIVLATIFPPSILTIPLVIG